MDEWKKDARRDVVFVDIDALVQDAFCRAIDPLLTDRARIIGDLEAVKEGLCDEADLIEKQEKLTAEMEVLEGLMHKAIMVNAETAQDQEEYTNAMMAMRQNMKSWKSSTAMPRQKEKPARTRPRSLPA